VEVVLKLGPKKGRGKEAGGGWCFWRVSQGGSQIKKEIGKKKKRSCPKGEIRRGMLWGKKLSANRKSPPLEGAPKAMGKGKKPKSPAYKNRGGGGERRGVPVPKKAWNW